MPSLYERVLISIGQTFLEEPPKKNIYPAILYVIDVDHPEMTLLCPAICMCESQNISEI